MDKIKVLVTRRWPVEVEEELKKKYDVTLNENDKPLTIDELKSALQNYDCLCPTVTDPINEEVLSVENKRAKIILENSNLSAILYLLGIREEQFVN